MALTDSAVLVPGVGHVLAGAVDATKPALADLTAFAANTATLPTGFTNLGHTSIDDVLTFGQEGGDTEVKGSWQNSSLREVITEATVDYFVIPALQVDNDVLTLYYGGGTITTANEFHVPDSPVPQEKAICVIMLDGSTPVALYIAKCSIRREDAPEFATDDFTKWPLRFTPLKSGSTAKMIWIADRLGAAA